MADDCHGIHAQVDAYLRLVRSVLDSVRAGAITETNAIHLHRIYATDLNATMTDAFVARLLELATAPPVAGAAPAPPAGTEPIAYVHRAHHPSTSEEPTSDGVRRELGLPADQAATSEGK